MNRTMIIKMMTLFLLITVTTMAQHKKKDRGDSLTVYREFAALGRWYLQQPLQMHVHFSYTATPRTGVQDSAETDMQIYYSKNDFYMQAEGMEQIANDSMIVMVNNEARMIRLYRNNGQMLKKMENSISVLVPDSSLEKLAEQYSAIMQNEGQNRKRVELQSRDKVSGTGFFKEILAVTYDAATSRPLTYQHIKNSLLPVDSVTYGRLMEDAAYDRRLVNTKVNEGSLYFIVKEKITQCRYSNVNHSATSPPAREQDRVVRAPDGAYQPAKGYETYMVSTEW